MCGLLRTIERFLCVPVRVCMLAIQDYPSISVVHANDAVHIEFDCQHYDPAQQSKKLRKFPLVPPPLDSVPKATTSRIRAERLTRYLRALIRCGTGEKQCATTRQILIHIPVRTSYNRSGAHHNSCTKPIIACLARAQPGRRSEAGCSTSGTGFF